MKQPPKLKLRLRPELSCTGASALGAYQQTSTVPMQKTMQEAVDVVAGRLPVWARLAAAEGQLEKGGPIAGRLDLGFSQPNLPQPHTTQQIEDQGSRSGV